MGWGILSFSGHVVIRGCVVFSPMVAGVTICVFADVWDAVYYNICDLPLSICALVTSSRMLRHLNKSDIGGSGILERELSPCGSIWDAQGDTG